MMWPNGSVVCSHYAIQLKMYIPFLGGGGGCAKGPGGGNDSEMNCENYERS